LVLPDFFTDVTEIAFIKIVTFQRDDLSGRGIEIYVMVRAVALQPVAAVF